MNPWRSRVELWPRTRARWCVAAAVLISLLSTPTVGAAGPAPANGQGWWCEAYRCGQSDQVAVDLVSAHDGWMIEVTVEGNGTLARWDGQRWQTSQTPATGRLRALDMSSASEGWAMGLGTVALHWGTAGWTAVTVPNVEIHDVDSLTPQDAWAVGGACDASGNTCTSTILRWNGQTWSAIASPSPYPLLSIDMVSSDDGWAVGGRCLSENLLAASCSHIILRWNGTTWAVWLDENGADKAPYSDVSLADATTGWMLESGTRLLRWNGTQWLPDTQAAVGIDSVDAVSGQAAWAAGSSGLQRWDGVSWSPVDQTGHLNWRAIDVDPGGYGAVVGTLGASMALNGAVWSPTTRFLGGDIFSGVDIISPTEAWAVGASGLFQRVNDRWRRWDLPPLMDAESLEDVDFAAADEGWAVGNMGTALHWDGESWSQAPTRIGGSFNDVQSISKSSAWAWAWIEVLGVYHGQVVHWEGRDWTATDIPGVTGLPTALAMRTDTDGWLATRNGELTHWNGAGWTMAPSPTSSEVLGIDIFAEDDAWAVGDAGTLLHWDGTEWTLTSSPTQADLFAVALAATDDGWAVGDGVILHWDGVSWASVEPGDRPVVGLAYDVDVVGDTGLIAGYQTLLRLDALHTQFLPTLLQASR